MTESNQIQIQSQTNNQVKSNLKIIEVSKRVYNVVRSIVDSSTKPDYHWNKPIIVDEKTVKFVKYKLLSNGLEVKAWTIVVNPMSIQKEGAELNAILISVWDGLGYLVADLVIRSEFTTYEPRKSYTLTIINEPDNIEINADSVHEYEYYFVSPSEPVPYANPISIAEFVNKLMFYYFKALSVIQNVNASKANEI